MIPLLLLLLQLPAPQDRAVGYMSLEVPKWPAENRCFSCHNNGDGARALILADPMKYPGARAALETTLEWLKQPEEWGKSGQTGFGDEKLARIQFAAALSDAIDAGLVEEKALLARAADFVAAHQEEDGSWQVDAQASTPSAVTYGPVLATFMARRTLDRTGEARFASASARADAWLLGKADTAAVVNAAALVLAFEKRADASAAARRDQALQVLMEGQNANGGWGAFPRTPAEPFESAMALLALNTVKEKPGVAERIRKGRAFLAGVQYEDGGWPTTTHSSSLETYARHFSTSAWATLALLATKD